MAAPSVDEFEARIPQMPVRDRKFATGLANSWRKYGHLTTKMAFWVTKLYSLQASEAAVEEVKVVGIARIRAMFDRAAKRLKFPKIWLGTEESPLRLSIAGPRSRYAGSIMVTDGRPFGVNRFYGSINEAGELTPGRDLTPQVSSELSELGADPEGKAMAFGRMSGHCCFCNLPLTTEKSVSVGYGPVCAKTFGLKWGSVAVDSAQDELLQEAA